jgi:ureidoglycolate lyase
MPTLIPEPLSRESFAAYGDVIESSSPNAAAMNAERFERFDDLCRVEAHDGHVAVSIARCRSVTTLPYRFDMIERHPHGSQAVVPLTPCRMLVVVAPPGDSVAAGDLRAFVSNGRQGINYHRGTWHMPLIAFEQGQEFLVIDRSGKTLNCDQIYLDEPIILSAAAIANPATARVDR